MEGCLRGWRRVESRWTLLRRWLRPYAGLQDKFLLDSSFSNVHVCEASYRDRNGCVISSCVCFGSSSRPSKESELHAYGWAQSAMLSSLWFLAMLSSLCYVYVTRILCIGGNWKWYSSWSDGHAALKVLEKEKLQENAFVVGSYMKERLTSLKEKYERNVRGRGLMLGVELVTDRHLKTPAKTEILHVMEQMKDVGVLIGKGGLYGNVFESRILSRFTKEDAGEHLLFS
ncbi:hypothetical protein Syun_023913 [Stephania yunnanensis]|uniref:Uncharacterized protein n=1 Tax=Stephania yunnanensis TaxID=152371 RepID=A0AAP0FDQ9_9MAGN